MFYLLALTKVAGCTHLAECIKSLDGTIMLRLERGSLGELNSSIAPSSTAQLTFYFAYPYIIHCVGVRPACVLCVVCILFFSGFGSGMHCYKVAVLTWGWLCGR